MGRPNKVKLVLNLDYIGYIASLPVFFLFNIDVQANMAVWTRRINMPTFFLNQSHITLSYNNLFFLCNIAITNFLVSHTTRHNSADSVPTSNLVCITEVAIRTTLCIAGII